MGIETPNLLSRETTFLMGILKKCLSVEKTQNEPNDQISSLSVSGHSVPPTEADRLTPVEADPLASMEGVFSHSVLPTEADPLASTEGVFGHSVPLMETAPLTSTDRSQMNCASISDTAELQTPPQIVLKARITIHFLLQICLSHKKRLKLPMQTYFQGLGKFPGEPSS